MLVLYCCATTPDDERHHEEEGKYQAGFEPFTTGSQGKCSTAVLPTELWRQDAGQSSGSKSFDLDKGCRDLFQNPSSFQKLVSKMTLSVKQEFVFLRTKILKAGLV